VFRSEQRLRFMDIRLKAYRMQEEYILRCAMSLRGKIEPPQLETGLLTVTPFDFNKTLKGGEPWRTLNGYEM
jgi:hypothetical protein